MSTEQSDRKNSHLSICLEEQIEFPAGDANGFAGLRFDHDALPEVSKAEIMSRMTAISPGTKNILYIVYRGRSVNRDIFVI